MSDLCAPSTERVTESQRKEEKRGVRRISIDGDRWSDSEVKEEQ